MRNIRRLFLITILISGWLSISQAHAKNKNRSKSSCMMATILNSRNTPALAKAFYNNQVEYNEAVLEYFDSLTSLDTKIRLFYFRVFTNTAQYADGILSESLFNGAYTYSTQHSVLFLKTLAHTACLSSKDAKTWARYVSGYLSITYSYTKDTTLLKQYLGQLQPIIKKLHLEQNYNISLFTATLTHLWNQEINHN